MNYPISIVLLLASSAFFSACETSFVSLNEAQIQAFKKRYKVRGRVLDFFITHASQLLNTILVGNNATNVLISVLTARFSLLVLGSEFLALMSGLILLVLLFFGEIVPKQIAIENNMFVIHIGLFPLLLCYYLMFPLSYLLDLMTQGIKKVFKSRREFSRSQDKLLHIFYHSSNTGIISHSTVKMLSSILHMSTLTAERVMTHRTKIIKLPSNATIAVLNSISQRDIHTRYPIYDPNNPEYITGVFNTQNIALVDTDKPLSYYQENPHVISEKQRIDELLPLFFQGRIHLSIVLDEFGGLAGLITLFDIAEFVFSSTPLSLLGFFDKNNTDEAKPFAIDHKETPEKTPEKTSEQTSEKTPEKTSSKAQKKISKKNSEKIQTEYSHEIDATTDLSHIITLTESQPPDDVHATTIGGYIQELLGRLPVKGEVVTTALGEFKITRVRHNRIERVIRLHS